MQRERRSEVRMLCADLVDVWWRDPDGKIRKAQGVLEDISASGACFQFEIRVPPGVMLHWRSTKEQFVGIVRYCVYRETGYFAGVQFDPGTRWSKEKYRPRHLLDLERLMQRAAGSQAKREPARKH